MRIAGIVIVLVGLLMGIGANLSDFIDPPSLIIIGAFTLGVLLAGGVSIPAMFRALVSSSATSAEAARAARAWGLARRAAVAAGYIGTVVGAVIILRNVEDIGSIGPGVAICIMTLFYGILVGYGLCLPCQHYLESKSD